MKDWSVRGDCVLGKCNVKDASLVNLTKVLPLLNLKLGLMKNFLNALDKRQEVCAGSFRISAMPKLNKGSLSAHKFEMLCLTGI